jgi:hypothetical protein
MWKVLAINLNNSIISQRNRARNSFVLVTGIAINYGYSQWGSLAIGLAREQVNKEMQENAL